MEFSASLFLQRHGIELTFGCKEGEESYGTNLAVLAHNIMSTYDSSNIPVPQCPRPDFNGDLNELHEIIIEFVRLIDDSYEYIKNNI